MLVGASAIVVAVFMLPCLTLTTLLRCPTPSSLQSHPTQSNPTQSRNYDCLVSMLDQKGHDFGDIRRVLERGMKNGAVSLMKDVS